MENLSIYSSCMTKVLSFDLSKVVCEIELLKTKEGTYSMSEESKVRLQSRGGIYGGSRGRFFQGIE